MKLEYVSNLTLRASIKKSYARISDRLRTEKVITTKLFVFEKMDCSELEAQSIYAWNSCLKVTVVATGEKLVITRRFSFGQHMWNLYRVVEVE